MLISASDIIRKSTALYRDNWQLCLKYMAIFAIPFFIQNIASYFLLPFKITVNNGDAAYDNLNSIIIMALIIGIVDLWISFAFVRALAARYMNAQPRAISEELKSVVQIMLPAILVTILVGLAVIGGLFLLIVPGIIFAVWFAFASYAVVLDNQRGTKALSYSKKMVAGRWADVFWRLIAPGLAFVIVMLALQWVLSAAYTTILSAGASLPAVQGGASISIATLGLSILSSLITLFMTPLFTAAQTILYLELKKTPVKAEPLAAS